MKREYHLTGLLVLVLVLGRAVRNEQLIVTTRRCTVQLDFYPRPFHDGYNTFYRLSVGGDGLHWGKGVVCGGLLGRCRAGLLAASCASCCRAQTSANGVLISRASPRGRHEYYSLEPGRWSALVVYRS